MRVIGQAHNVSVAQVALAWLLHQPAVSSIIIGAKRPEQLADNIAAIELELSADELQQLNDSSRLAPEYPGWMLAYQGEFRRSQIAAARRNPSAPPAKSV